MGNVVTDGEFLLIKMNKFIFTKQNFKKYTKYNLKITDKLYYYTTNFYYSKKI